MDTFLMATKEGKVEKAVLDSFDLHEEKWVVHQKGDGFSCSHRETGYGVPRSYSLTQEETTRQGKEAISKQDPVKLAGMLKGLR